MSTKYEMSKTYQYRKVMKPLLERKRRARINKCLDDIKELITERIQLENGRHGDDDATKNLEKADILELTVQHLRKLKMQRQQQQEQTYCGNESFRNGYIQAANEVSKCLAMLPKVNIEFGTNLMTHLGLRLNQLESKVQENLLTPPINTPLNIVCNNTQISQRNSCETSNSSLYSPISVSSGYASDSENSMCSSSLPSKLLSKGLLQLAPSVDTSVWRPW